MSKLIKTAQEFEHAVKTEKKLLVLFYSAWCPFCTKFLPVFEKQCADLAGCCRIATDDAETVEDAYSIEVVPAVLCFENGAVSHRLDSIPFRGLTEKQLADFMSACGCTAGA